MVQGRPNTSRGGFVCLPCRQLSSIPPGSAQSLSAGMMRSILTHDMIQECLLWHLNEVVCPEVNAEGGQEPKGQK